MFRDIVGRGRPHVYHFFQKKIRLDGLLCSFVFFVFQKNALRGSVICSATSSGVDDPTYITFFKKNPAQWTFVFFCLFYVSKKRSTGICNMFRDIVGHGRHIYHFFQKKIRLDGLLCSFVSFVFQKNALRTFVFFCHFCVSKNPLYRLLSSFVSFVFQKNALRVSVICSAISSGVDDPTYITFFKKNPAQWTFVFFCLFCVSKKRSTGICNMFRDIVGGGRPHLHHFFQKKSGSMDFCVLLSLLCFKKTLYGLLSSFVTFVFQKTPSTDFCLLLSLLCLKKTLYGASMTYSATSSGVDNPTYVSFVFQKTFCGK